MTFSSVGASSSPIIELRSVSKKFAERIAVDDLDLEVPPGICFGLLGPNGAGKTTTLRMIYGTTRATSGSIRVFGLDIGAHRRAVKSRLGVTLQQNVLIEALSPRANLFVFGRYHLIPAPELARRVEELIDFLELRSHADLPVRQLSGGFQRRLAIALSLMNNPELLILDEPTTGLDPAVRLALWSRVRELRAGGKPFSSRRTTWMRRSGSAIASRSSQPARSFRKARRQISSRNWPRKRLSSIARPKKSATFFEGLLRSHAGFAPATA
jgi:ABC-type multidrug transport system ATPase subunit